MKYSKSFFSLKPSGFMSADLLKSTWARFRKFHLMHILLRLTNDRQATPHETRVLSFKVLRDNDTLAVLSTEADQSWKLLEGDMEQEQVNAIGAAIDDHSGLTNSLNQQ